MACQILRPDVHPPVGLFLHKLEYAGWDGRDHREQFLLRNSSGLHTSCACSKGNALQGQPFYRDACRIWSPDEREDSCAVGKELDLDGAISRLFNQRRNIFERQPYQCFGAVVEMKEYAILDTAFPFTIS